ncbi:histone-lysine N-methyltransferase SETMAR-like [Hyposmocoma kahamanoa]|uniref:histone-lysine N-methyltransferase SETMAR-like n=1 Tax=Hyposmocoma kahamanoa TaxID=1477025 RepID=UPI000E6D818F|nr:histone-lysine N-methyltransferase SETMAR-like [Hyposmocoma kahamanoa]
MTDPLEQRYAVKFCVLLGKNTVETNEMIKQAFKDKALSESSVRKWHKMFRDGREEVTDEARSGQAKAGVPLVPQPPYSPDVAPADFFLFPSIKSKLKGKHWGTIKDIQEATTRALKDLPVDVFQGAFRAWKTRLQKCIDAEGCYFEEY